MSLNNIINENDLIQEFRCSKCFLIPFIQFFVKNNNLIMKMKCFNNHENKKIIKEKEKNNENYFICNKCKENSNQNKQKNFFYCENCFKIFCEECKNFHINNNNNHKLINIKMIDNFCFEHEKNLIGFCLNHNKNFCKECSHFKENEIKFFSDFNENEINDCLKNILNNENDINELNSIFIQLKKSFENFEKNFLLFKKNVENRIFFIKKIIDFFKFKKNENKINFQMIENIKCNNFKIKNLKSIIQNQIQSQIQNFNEIYSLFNKNEENLENK